MKKSIVAFIFQALLVSHLLCQYTTSNVLSPYFSPYYQLYLKNTHADNFGCTQGFTNSLADNNRLDKSLSSPFIGISQNLQNTTDKYIPVGMLRIYDKANTSSKYFYTYIDSCWCPNFDMDYGVNFTHCLACADCNPYNINHDPSIPPPCTGSLCQNTPPSSDSNWHPCTISLNNSTYIGKGDYLLSGTRYLNNKTLFSPLAADIETCISMSGHPNTSPNNYSFGILGKTNIANALNPTGTDRIKYFHYFPMTLSLSNNRISGSTQPLDNASIIDAVPDGEGNIYFLGNLTYGGSALALYYIGKLNQNLVLQWVYPMTYSNGLIMDDILAAHKLYYDSTYKELITFGNRQKISSVPWVPNFDEPYIYKIDINNLTAKYLGFQNSGNIFDVKKRANGNYVLGYSEDHFHEHGYIELDNNFNILHSRIFDAHTWYGASNAQNSSYSSSSAVALFGANKFSTLHIKDTTNIQFYGWNSNGMSFANLYIGSNDTFANPSRFYNLILADDYINSPTGFPLPAIQTMHNINTTNTKYKEYAGVHPLNRKLLLNNNGILEFYKSGADRTVFNTCHARSNRMDKFLRRNMPIDVFPISTGVKSNMIQYVYDTSAWYSGESDDYYSMRYGCTNTLPVDFFSAEYGITADVSDSFEKLVDTTSGDLMISCGDIIGITSQNIDFIVDYIDTCSIGATAYNYQKSIGSNALGNDTREYIQSIEIWNVLGQKYVLTENTRLLVGTAFSEKCYDIISKEYSLSSVIIVNLITNKNKYSKKIALPEK